MAIRLAGWIANSAIVIAIVLSAFAAALATKGAPIAARTWAKRAFAATALAVLLPSAILGIGLQANTREVTPTSETELAETKAAIFASYFAAALNITAYAAVLALIPAAASSYAFWKSRKPSV